jgi:hypothetical protein
MNWDAELIDVDEAEAFLKLPGVLTKLRKNGNGPPFFKLSPQLVRYSKSELLDWMIGCKIVPA